jgi:hypothetical protein
MCLSNDVVTQDEGELALLMKTMSRSFEGLLPEKSSFEKQRGQRAHNGQFHDSAQLEEASFSKLTDLEMVHE